ncbi:putative RNA-binding protein [Spiroplasma syrphidicola EA-1]|uniref:Putative RNA-binding protein n=2 Tax=Spiroplasma TaxID=2132 RepID=R4U4K1_9MOLU|nr:MULTISPECIES: YlxR family protein [Spiroplasma]AGM25363.1 putative RNA-binding protein [Spiroplasma chrysopicola DF-1]AGM26412.1 putative RNA-binding protein [Spiroplasma syrphidicola EA-1]
MQKQKTTPLRKCVVSNQMLPKKELIRIVKTPTGEVKIDLTGKANGRGAYLRPTKEVYLLAKKNHALERALKVKLTDEFYQQLEQEVLEGWD